MRHFLSSLIIKHFGAGLSADSPQLQSVCCGKLLQGHNLCSFYPKQKKLPYMLECKMRIFPEIWHLNMQGHLKFVYEAPNWIALNRTMRSQTKACIPNHHMKSVLFRDIMQCRVVIPYGHFATTYLSHLQRSTNQKERTEYD